MPEEDVSESSDGLFVSSDFDIFAHKPVLTAVQETIHTICKPIAPVEQSDLEFIVPPDNDTYIDLDIKIYV